MKNKEESGTVPALPVSGHIVTTEAVRLRWAGHVQGMGSNKIHRRIVNSNLERSASLRRPKRRWMDGMVTL